MIRIRRRDKSVIELPKDAIFVELVDDYGDVIQVFSEDKMLHGFLSFGHPSDRADIYAKYFNVNFVKNHYNLGDGKQLLVNPENSKTNF